MIPMKIAELLADVEVLTRTAPPGLEVAGVQCDSRRIRPGDLFVTIHGAKDDGLRFVPAALEKCAAAVLSEAPPSGGIPWIQVRDARGALAQIACALHGHPSRHMAVHAITGTNGKTTVAGLLRDFLSAAGHTPGLISTVQYEYGARILAASRTTPDACELQSLLAAMRASGCDSAVMEASSHAIDQRRIGGMRLVSAAFTNLSHDHLDYHKDLPHYFEAKAGLFDVLAAGNPGAPAIINADDPYGRRLIAALPAKGLEVISYGFAADASVRAEQVVLSSQGTVFRFRSPWGEVTLCSQLMGRFNVSNQLCAAAMALRAGVSLDVVVAAIAAARPRWGRLEKVATPLPCEVFVDYAHTDDALDKVLTTLREITPRRLIVVFGCGGNRDRTKRPLMGRVAAMQADHAIITSDNPRTEEPLEIIREIVAGLPPGASFENVPDRREAILTALRQGAKGDVVLIAGKGHENYQEFANRVIPFDDREQVRSLAAVIRSTI
jgi:UDP-N-acetylmuramoyl-L-alanyl-D-glutamate--2,6-diaminopimelate ligase